MWVLILSIYVPWSPYNGSVEHVPGFKSEAACQAAADAWRHQMKDYPGKEFTLCAKQD
jgi:hypothetical protein